MKRLAFLLPVTMLTACVAHVEHSRVVDDDKASGIRYYLNAPYLIVYSNGKGGLNWQIRYLPDQTRIMIADPHVFGAHLEMTMNFQNGVLSNTTATGYSTGVPKALITAVQNVLPLLLKSLAAGPAQPGFPAPSIFKIVARGDTVQFIGSKPDISIQVPIKQGD